MRIGLLVFVLIFFVSISKCHKMCYPTIDITDGIRKQNHIIKNNIDYGPDDYYNSENGTILGCICDIKVCVRKCCPLTETVQEKLCTAVNDNTQIDFMKDIEEKFINPTVSEDSLYVIDGMVECGEKMRIKLNYEENFTLLPNGSLNWFGEIERHDYCIDYFGSTNRMSALVCSNEQDVELIHFSIGMIISMPFLIATFLVYALLPDKNLPAKSLMCYVLSLLFAYVMLVTIQLNSHLQELACNTIAFLCYFFFMASFFWMNSSCIDIWLTFSGIKGMTGQRTQERKRFIYYCLYSWGLPLIMTAIVVVLTTTTEDNSAFATGIGSGQCWFKHGLPTGIYFYFPIAALLIANVILFVITALKIRNVQRGTKDIIGAKDSSKHEKEKQRFNEDYNEPCYLIEPVKNHGMQVYDFLDEDNSCLGFNLYVKLLFAMGVNWSMEVISWIVMWQTSSIPNYVWYITDFCNAMYGVLIFFIFVFKKNIWLMLKKRYLQFMGRPAQAHSMGTSTHRTTVSQVTSSEA